MAYIVALVQTMEGMSLPSLWSMCHKVILKILFHQIAIILTILSCYSTTLAKQEMKEVWVFYSNRMFCLKTSCVGRYQKFAIPGHAHTFHVLWTQFDVLSDCQMKCNSACIQQMHSVLAVYEISRSGRHIEVMDNFRFAIRNGYWKASYFTYISFSLY